MAYRIIGNTHGLEDVEAFLEVASQGPAVVRGLFQPGQPIFVTRAPGRLDVMGGIADYAGALVLQWPLQEATCVALQKSENPEIQMVSLGPQDGARSLTCTIPVEALVTADGPVAYETARAFFARQGRSGWAAYVAGCLLVLLHETALRFTGGVRILISSQVPEGKGVSSSAALEVATMQALNYAYGLDLTPKEVALLCQRVENHVVGAPCGVMDQMASACGRAGQLLALRCQPAELEGYRDVPASLRIWGIDSGVRHAVSGSDYRKVRIGTFMGFKMLKAALGAAAPAYLAQLSPSHYAALTHPLPLPSMLSGRAFIDQYGSHEDAATHIDPEEIYAVRAPVEHAVYEHFRIETFSRLLRPDGSAADHVLLGELMYQSHESYTRCDLGSAATEAIVAQVRRLGPAEGLYGAKITGGGSGGTVAVLGDASAGASVQRIVDERTQTTGHRPTVFTGTSPGAGAFGYLTLAPPS